MDRFGFIVHPMNLDSILQKWPYVRYVSDDAVRKLISLRKPLVIGEMRGIVTPEGKRTEGVVVAVPLLPDQFYSLKEKRVIRKIACAVNLAAEEGAKIVGLGAFTAIPGNGGKELIGLVDVPVTTGNTYTVEIAIEAIEYALQQVGRDPSDSILAVFGATGSIGRAVSIILAPKFKKTILIGRNMEKLKKVQEETSAEVEITTDLTRLTEADAVVTVSGAADAPVKADMLKPGAVVCDIARPRDVSREVSRKRKDVLVIDGGIVDVPGNFVSTVDIGLPPGKALACMAETMILALEGRFENYTIGKNISVDRVQEIRSMAEKHGFKLGGLRSFDRELPEERVKHIRNINLVSHVS